MIHFLTVLWIASVLVIVIRRFAVLHIHHGHTHAIECLACRDRRRVVRFATIGIVAIMIVSEIVTAHAFHWPDVGFLALVIVTEIT